MKPQFRILQNKNGNFEVYYIEKINFFGKEILKPFITRAGLDDVFPFSNLDLAIDELKKEAIKQTERAEYKNYKLKK